MPTQHSDDNYWTSS